MARRESSGDPLSIRFALSAVPPATRLLWNFGDDEESRDDSPTHKYAKPGRYEVSVQVTLKGGKKYKRRRVIHVGS